MSVGIPYTGVLRFGSVSTRSAPSSTFEPCLDETAEHNRPHTRWTRQEDERLRSYCSNGGNAEEVALEYLRQYPEVGRTLQAVRQRAQKLRGEDPMLRPSRQFSWIHARHWSTEEKRGLLEQVQNGKTVPETTSWYFQAYPGIERTQNQVASQVHAVIREAKRQRISLPNPPKPRPRTPWTERELAIVKEEASKGGSASGIARRVLAKGVQKNYRAIVRRVKTTTLDSASPTDKLAISYLLN